MQKIKEFLAEDFMMEGKISVAYIMLWTLSAGCMLMLGIGTAFAMYLAMDIWMIMVGMVSLVSAVAAIVLAACVITKEHRRVVKNRPVTVKNRSDLILRIYHGSMGVAP